MYTHVPVYRYYVRVHVSIDMYVLDEVCVSLSDEVSLSLSDSLLSVLSRVFFLLFLMCFKETIASS